MSKEFEHELQSLIRARYSIIYINTVEEERALDIIKRVCIGLNKRVITWTSTRGLELNGNALDPRSVDLKTALDIAEGLAKEPSIFVWIDVHPFIKPGSNPIFIRKFRESAQRIRLGLPSNSLIIASVVEIPVELQKEITILDLPLPTLEEARDIIFRFASQYKNREGIQIDTSAKTLESLARASLGLCQSEIENCLAKALVENRRIGSEAVELLLREKQQVVRKSGILEYVSTESMTLSEVGGLENLKRWLEKRRQAYTLDARKFGVDWPKGVLLVGVPGCGKSLSAKCVAASWGMPLLRLDLGKVFAGVVGSSEANIRTALSTCEAVAPAIVWIDEIEKALSGSSSGASDGGTATRVFGTLLTWMQEKKSPVFVFATANQITGLPPELLRKGRFDEIFFVDLPNAAERAEIFKICITKIGRDPSSIDIDQLVKASGESMLGEGVRLTGAEIESVVKEALLDAYNEKLKGSENRDLTTEDILRAISRTVPLAKLRRNEIDSLRQWATEHAVRASVPVAAGSIVTGGETEEQQVEIAIGRNIDF